ncbi:MAG: Ferritin-like protein [Acidimicrobiales bacterium]|nr:Ferritin-like protein [Acidimicrobiales bacterium]
MRMRKKDAIQISEGELNELATDLDAIHYDVAMPAMRRSIDDLLEANRLTRRRFLVGSGAVALGGVALAACGSSSKKSSTATTAASTGPLTGDLQIAAMAASLEILAVQTYQAGLSAAQAGRLGAVPPALADFSKTVISHHQQHAGAWNSILTNAGKAKVSKPDPVVKPQVDQMFGQVKDVPGLAKLALQLEDIAAATYLNGIGVLQDNKAVAIAASIQPVEMQHAAILNFVLGQYPVPNSFAKTDGARPPSDYS